MYKITDEKDFQTVTSEHRLVLLDVYTSWCGPCKQLAPKLEQLSREESEIFFCKVDADENEFVTDKYNITSVPTIVALKNGKEIGRSGNNLEKIKELIKNLKLRE